MISEASRKYPIRPSETWAAIRLIFPDSEEAYTSGAEALGQAGRTHDADALCEYPPPLHAPLSGPRPGLSRYLPITL